MIHYNGINQQNESWIELDELGSIMPIYKPTYQFPDEFINENHSFYSACKTNGHRIDISIKGSIRKEEALKLYEIAFFAENDILELGTGRGLSTSILSQANYDSGLRKDVFTVDLMKEYTKAAEETLKYRDVCQKTYLFTNDAELFIDELIRLGRSFDFVFIDHSHKYEDVKAVAKKLLKIVNNKGFCLFHDYNDGRNNDPNNKDYGVPQGVRDGLSKDHFDFYGIYGSAALFRKKPF